jgi:hypothetical protein
VTIADNKEQNGLPQKNANYHGKKFYSRIPREKRLTDIRVLSVNEALKCRKRN